MGALSQDEIFLGLLALQEISTNEQSILTEDEPDFTIQYLVLQLSTASHYLSHYSSWLLLCSLMVVSCGLLLELFLSFIKNPFGKLNSTSGTISSFYRGDTHMFIL